MEEKNYDVWISAKVLIKATVSAKNEEEAIEQVWCNDYTADNIENWTFLAGNAVEVEKEDEEDEENEEA